MQEPAASDSPPGAIEPESFQLEGLLKRESGYEQDLVRQYSDRLLRLASTKMPAVLQARVDPADIVQSAFRSFFTRHEGGTFCFSKTDDIWRLLAAITFHKVQRAIRHNSQQLRDVRREVSCGNSLAATEAEEPTASSLSIMAETLDAILSQLPNTHRIVLQQRLQGHSVEEIATQLSISTRTVNRGLKLARQIATKIVQDDAGESC